ncbi:hypothetical protein [Aliikangiella coralliicola]|uniref:Uncharacterized protein n=1 Tax=Aliikangiella coralliicola TaxID=2592383 RepID=A0A545U8M1_9GAMM|nr:hypothetical protein [Aliikangiella coralliicola]TQV85815.1 hypothetical protein FLL46_17980 [Aliikangiella coralliicola]
MVRYSKRFVDSRLNGSEHYYDVIDIILRSKDFDEGLEFYGVGRKIFLAYIFCDLIATTMRSGVEPFYELEHDFAVTIQKAIRTEGYIDIANALKFGEVNVNNEGDMEKIKQWIYENEEYLNETIRKLLNEEKSKVYQLCRVTEA